MKNLKLTLLALAAGLTLSFSSFAQGKVDELSVVKTTTYLITPSTLLVPSKDLPSVSNVYWRIKVTFNASNNSTTSAIPATYEAERVVNVSSKNVADSSYPDGEWVGSINFRPADVQNQLNDIIFGFQSKKKEPQVTIVIPPIKEEEIDEIQK